MAEQFRRVAIVGIGLKGGSLAMVLRKKRIAKEVVNSIVHVLAYYRLKLKELSEVLQGGNLQDLQKLL